MSKFVAIYKSVSDMLDTLDYSLSFEKFDSSKSAKSTIAEYQPIIDELNAYIRHTVFNSAFVSDVDIINGVSFVQYVIRIDTNSDNTKRLYTLYLDKKVYKTSVKDIDSFDSLASEFDYLFTKNLSCDTVVNLPLKPFKNAIVDFYANIKGVPASVNYTKFVKLVIFFMSVSVKSETVNNNKVYTISSEKGLDKALTKVLKLHIDGKLLDVFNSFKVDNVSLVNKSA